MRYFEEDKLSESVLISLTGQDHLSQPTPIIEKALNTIEALQEVARDFPDYELLESIRQTDPQFLSAIQQHIWEQERQFIETHGLEPGHVEWFAKDREVSLDEMLAMVLVAEGGSVAQSEELIVLLANRARTFAFLGATRRAENAGVDYSQLLNAQGLLENYTPDPANVARYIINNIFGHDDSFLGAQDRDYELGVLGARTPEEQQAAWRNLTQDPRKLPFGSVIMDLAQAIVDPEKWSTEYNRTVDGRAIFSQANQNLFPDVAGDNEFLNRVGQGKLLVEPTVTGYSVFLNACQQLALRRRAEGNSEDQIREILEAEGCMRS